MNEEMKEEEKKTQKTQQKTTQQFIWKEQFFHTFCDSFGFVLCLGKTL